MNTPTQQNDSKAELKKSRPSYWPGLSFLIAAIVVEIIGRVIVALIKNATHGLGTRDVIVMLNNAAAIRGITDVIMLVLGIIGIILLIRVKAIRSRASKS